MEFNPSIYKLRVKVATDPNMENTYETFHAKLIVSIFDELGLDLSDFPAGDIVSNIVNNLNKQPIQDNNPEPNRLFSEEIEIYAADILQTEAEFYKDNRRTEREIAADNLAKMGFSNLDDNEKALLLEAIQDQWEIELESLNDYTDPDTTAIKEKIVLLNGISKMSAVLDGQDPDSVVDMKLEDFR